MDRPFRFAVQAGAPPKGLDWTTYARHIEALGYGTLVTADHVVGDGLAPFPALAAAATATRQLRVGTLVVDNDFRNPLLLAREAATVDVISNGRLELGFGAGWLRRDNDSLGIAYDPPAVRVQRLAEAVPLLKRVGETGSSSSPWARPTSWPSSRGRSATAHPIARTSPTRRRWSVPSTCGGSPGTGWRRSS